MSDIGFQYPNDRDRYVNRPGDVESRLTRIERLISKLAPWSSGRPVFASTSVRDTAGIPKTVGQLCYVTATDTEYLWTGSAWRLWNYPVVAVGGVAWTPTFSNFTIGNGAYTTRYQVRQGNVDIRGEIIFGSTTAWASGSPSISLPYAFRNVSPAFDESVYLQSGAIQVIYYDNTAGRSVGGSYAVGTNEVGFLAEVPSGSTNVVLGVPNSSSPFIWAVNDKIWFSGSYPGYIP